MADINHTPRLSFSAFCKYMKAPTSTAQLGILRTQKFPKEGPMKSYVAATERIKQHLVDGRPLTHGGLRDYEADALKAFASNWSAPAGHAYDRPQSYQQKLEILGVEISCFPTVLVRRAKTGRTGAMKVFLNKDPKIDGDLGKTMATLLYYFLDEVAGEDVDPGLVTVLESRKGAEHQASPSTTRLLKNVEDTCFMVGSVWDRLGP